MTSDGTRAGHGKPGYCGDGQLGGPGTEHHQAAIRTEAALAAAVTPHGSRRAEVTSGEAGRHDTPNSHHSHARTPAAAASSPHDLERRRPTGLCSSRPPRGGTSAPGGDRVAQSSATPRTGTRSLLFLELRPSRREAEPPRAITCFPAPRLPHMYVDSAEPHSSIAVCDRETASGFAHIHMDGTDLYILHPSTAVWYYSAPWNTKPMFLSLSRSRLQCVRYVAPSRLVRSIVCAHAGCTAMITEWAAAYPRCIHLTPGLESQEHQEGIFGIGIRDLTLPLARLGARTLTPSAPASTQ